MIFQRLLRGPFGNLEAIHDSSLGCLEDHAGASRQTSTYESVPRLDMRECLDLARPLPRWMDGWMDGSDRGPTPGFRQRAGPAPRRSPHTAQMRVDPQPMGI